MKHIIEYTLPYDHVVRFGLEARTRELALEIAEELFDTGELYNRGDIPFLLDDYNEQDSVETLEFKVVASLQDGESWPEPEASIVQMQNRDKALQVALLLVQARRSSPDTSTRFDDDMLEEAYAKALTIAFDF